MATEMPPTPTPIATGKGSRASAVNDGVLSKYLESSLRIPNLALPTPFPCSLSHIHRKIPSGIDYQSLRNGDENAVRLLLAAAAGTGAFRIDGHGLALEEMRSVVDLAATRGGGVVGVDDEVVRWVGNMGGVEEELRWSESVEEEDAAAGRAPVTETYRLLREKLENLSSKLEAVAETVNQVISTNIKNPSPPKIVAARKGHLLLLRKHDLRHRGRHGERGKEATPHHDHPSHSLGLHMSPGCREFRLRSEEGSTTYGVPGGSLIVTIGRQLQEWSKGELKGVIGEPVFDRSSDPKPCFSLEFMSSPLLPRRRRPAPSARRHHHHITSMDQVLMGVALAFLFYLWFFDPSKSRKS